MNLEGLGDVCNSGYLAVVVLKKMFVENLRHTSTHALLLRATELRLKSFPCVQGNGMTSSAPLPHMGRFKQRENRDLFGFCFQNIAQNQECGWPQPDKNPPLVGLPKKYDQGQRDGNNT
jgi:hypothetical protein